MFAVYFKAQMLLPLGTLEPRMGVESSALKIEVQ